MAKRMFSSAIIESDIFLEMPLTAQALYMHLCMNADNEGFVGSPNSVQKMIGASGADMQILLDNRYILKFPSGIIVIKHWYINNNIRQDQAKKTTYIEEKEQLILDGKQAYTEKKTAEKQPIDNQLTGNQQVINSKLTGKYPPSIEEYSIEEKSIVESSIEKKAQARTHTQERDANSLKENDFASDLDVLSGIPTLQEVKDFIILKQYNIDAEYFYNYYSAQGWKRHGQPIENWQALLTQWGRTENLRDGLKRLPGASQQNINTRKYTDAEMADIFSSSMCNDDDI